MPLLPPPVCRRRCDCWFRSLLRFTVEPLLFGLLVAKIINLSLQHRL